MDLGQLPVVCLFVFFKYIYVQMAALRQSSSSNVIFGRGVA